MKPMNKSNNRHQSNRQQHNNNRRGGRSNGGGRRPHNNNNNILSKNFESRGPEVKIRGTASHIADKYIAMARDANVSGDPVKAENLLQHAEHYNRIVMAAQAQKEEAAANRMKKNNERREQSNERRTHSSQNERPPQVREKKVAAKPSENVDIATPQPEVEVSSGAAPAFLTKPVAEKPKRTPRRRSPVKAKTTESDADDSKAVSTKDTEAAEEPVKKTAEKKAPARPRRRKKVASAEGDDAPKKVASAKSEKVKPGDVIAG